MNFKFSWGYSSWSTFGSIPFSESHLLKDLELHLSLSGVWTDFMGSSSDNLQRPWSWLATSVYQHLEHFVQRKHTFDLWWRPRGFGGIEVKLQGAWRANWACAWQWPHNAAPAESRETQTWAAVIGVRAWTAQRHVAQLCFIHLSCWTFWFCLNFNVGKSIIYPVGHAVNWLIPHPPEAARELTALWAAQCYLPGWWIGLPSLPSLPWSIRQVLILSLDTQFHVLWCWCKQSFLHVHTMYGANAAYRSLSAAKLPCKPHFPKDPLAFFPYSKGQKKLSL